MKQQTLVVTIFSVPHSDPIVKTWRSHKKNSEPKKFEEKKEINSDFFACVAQLDLEMSFADMEGIMNLTEQILKHSWPEEHCGPLKVPFRRLKYKEALAKYGTDKPDLRYLTKVLQPFSLTSVLARRKSDVNYLKQERL